MRFKLLRPVLPVLALPLLATSGLAQQMAGQSHPEQLNDGITTPAQTEHYVKPSRAASDAVPSAAPVVRVPAEPAYQQSYPATGQAPAAEPVLLPRQPTAAVTGPSEQPTDASAGVENASVVRTTRPEPAEDDSGIVLAVPVRPHELNDGTLLKVRLQKAISTEHTVAGTAFSAELLTDVGHSGEVMLPAGSILRGRITAIHGGKRIGGPASIRLQPSTVTLPDGTTYPLAATLTNLDGLDDAKVDGEGVIKHRNHPALAAGALTLTTGSAAVAGAMIGGGVGAAVGAGLAAGAGVIWFSKRDVQEALPAGAQLIFSLDQPLIVTPRYQQ